MNTITRGNLTEAMVTAKLIGQGFTVLHPFGEGHPFDLAVASDQGEMVRIQCKTGWRAGECMVFNARSTDHGNGAGSYRGLAELFAVYFRERDQVYLIPVQGLPTGRPHFRLAPARNNQRVGVRFARDFEVERYETGDIFSPPVEVA